MLSDCLKIGDIHGISMPLTSSPYESDFRKGLALAAVLESDLPVQLVMLQSYKTALPHRITVFPPWWNRGLATALSGKLKWQKISSQFRGCCENALIQGFETSPHLIVWILNP